MTNPIEPILAGSVFFVVFLATLQFFGRFLTDYRLGTAGIEFIFFQRFKFWSVPYEDVLSIEPISLIKLLFLPSLHFVNRPFAQHFILKRKRGIFRIVLMTPSNPEKFVDAIEKKIQK